jgi:DNA modification methylase
MTENKLICGDAAEVLSGFPDSCIDMVMTSPPYWNAVDYGDGGGRSSYENYLDGLQPVWDQISRVMRPNARFILNTALMPVPQSKQNPLPVRDMKPLPFDLDHRIRSGTDLLFTDLTVWQKQTTKAMFGVYPYPGNNPINNVVEFCVVYLKPGKGQKFSADVKQASWRTEYDTHRKVAWAEHVDLVQQIAFIMPTKIDRDRSDHPAPFPEKLVARPVALYTVRGALILDPFCGSGTVCAVAKKMHRHFVGVDHNPNFIKLAQTRVDAVQPSDAVELLVGRPKWPTQAEIAEQLAELRAEPAHPIDTARAEHKHKRRSYGRRTLPGQLDLPLNE